MLDKIVIVIFTVFISITTGWILYNTPSFQHLMMSLFTLISGMMVLHMLLLIFNKNYNL